MPTVPVPLPDRAYDIHIGHGFLADAARFVRPVVRGNQLMLVFDENLAEPHARVLEQSLSADGFVVKTLQLPAGETTKSVQHLAAIWDAFAQNRFGRDCALVALGGGVIGDLAGFAAASFMRGVDFVQVPTSLLAMVDSSVGGKTGINHPLAKNLIGAFWQPKLVLADLDVLHTLPKGERISALAEIIKYGVIYDPQFFAWLEKNIAHLRELKDDAVSHAVQRSCEIKAEVVLQDERETGLRKILNFGHTLGHAIENSAGYGVVRHGEAISIGMVAESRLQVMRGVPGWTNHEHARLVELLEAARLPVRIPGEIKLGLDTLIAAARSDKKNRSGKIRYALPTALGKMEDVSASEEEAAQVLLEVGARQ
jgi:3-dehydroquinate synthase